MLTIIMSYFNDTNIADDMQISKCTCIVPKSHVRLYVLISQHTCIASKTLLAQHDKKVFYCKVSCYNLQLLKVMHEALIEII